MPPKVSKAAAARIPGATFLQVAGGHLVHEEAEAAPRLAALIRDWLEATLSGQAGSQAGSQTGSASPKII